MSPDEQITKAVLQILNGTADEKTVDDLATLVCNYDGFDPTRERARGVIRRLIAAFTSARPEVLRTPTFDQVRDAIVQRMQGHTISAHHGPAWANFMFLLGDVKASECALSPLAEKRGG